MGRVASLDFKLQTACHFGLPMSLWIIYDVWKFSVVLQMFESHSLIWKGEFCPVNAPELFMKENVVEHIETFVDRCAKKWPFLHFMCGAITKICGAPWKRRFQKVVPACDSMNSDHRDGSRSSFDQGRHCVPWGSGWRDLAHQWLKPLQSSPAPGDGDHSGYESDELSDSCVMALQHANFGIESRKCMVGWWLKHIYCVVTES